MNFHIEHLLSTNLNQRVAERMSTSPKIGVLKINGRSLPAVLSAMFSMHVSLLIFGYYLYLFF